MPVVVRIRARAPNAPTALDAWSSALSNPEPAMQAVGEVLSADIGERFVARSDPWGSPWAALSPTTLEIRARRGGPMGVLERTRFVRIIDAGRRAAIGLASKVARVQHFGNPANRVFGRGPGPIPARPIIPSGREMPETLLAEVRAAFRAGFRAVLRR
jgi:hypothetical protein